MDVRQIQRTNRIAFKMQFVNPDTIISAWRKNDMKFRREPQCEEANMCLDAVFNVFFDTLGRGTEAIVVVSFTEEINALPVAKEELKLIHIIGDDLFEYFSKTYEDSPLILGYITGDAIDDVTDAI